MLCFKWQETKDVTMLSTIHEAVFVKTGKTDKEGKKIEKSEAVFYYCLRMGGVDLSDQLLNYFTFLRKSTKWSRKLLIHLFNLVILNAHILNKHYGCMKLTQDEYRGYLVKYLVPEGLKCYKMSLPSIISKKLGKHNTGIDMKGKRTSFGCEDCRKSLCIIPCFTIYHTEKITKNMVNFTEKWVISW